MGMYSTGKKSGGHNNGVTHNMGKTTPKTFSKVGASAGKSSGTRRDGDKSSAPAMGKGK